MKQRKSDILWKVVIEEVFDDLLRFLFPDADKVYDMERGFEFLDKELAEMHPEPDKKSDTRFADKLVKVFHRDGEEEWVLTHIEIQGETKTKDRPLFGERMFRYFYRIWDRFHKPVSVVAVFTGRDGKKMPGQFEFAYRKTRLLFEYHTLSILDFTDKELEESDNPFAQVVLAARMSLLEGKIPKEDLLEWKILIATKLLRKGFPMKKIRAILTFLENYVLFGDPKMNRIFRERVQLHDKDNIMNIDDYVKMISKDEGLEEGKREGRRKGRKEGVEKSKRLFVENLLSNTDFTVEKIASLANVTVKFVNKIKEESKAK
jgi:hypothetical protein